jgi:hypothetical protein
MFQPEAKLEFVRRYCPPSDGWAVYVDIDPSEMGETGGPRKSVEARERQTRMKDSGKRAAKELRSMGATVCGSQNEWVSALGLGFDLIVGDRDIVAVRRASKTLLVAEVEGASSGQPEQKLYKAIGQVVMSLAAATPTRWTRYTVVVVHGAAMSAHLRKATALAKLGVAGLSICEKTADDEWMLDDRFHRGRAPS